MVWLQELNLTGSLSPSTERAMRLLAIMAILLTTGGASQAHDLARLRGDLFEAEYELLRASQYRDQILQSATATPSMKDMAQAVYSNNFRWNRASRGETTVSVCFWPSRLENGQQRDNAALIREIIAVARRWTAVPNVSFDFGSDSHPRQCVDFSSANIRVTLDPQPANYYSSVDPVNWNWSRYGKASVQNRARVSMSLIDVRSLLLTQRLIDFNFLVSHEFGHALGLIHEHQRVDCVSWLESDSIVMSAYGWTRPSDLVVFKENLKNITEGDGLRPTYIGPLDLSNSVMMYNFVQSIWREPRPGEGPNPCRRLTEVEFPSQVDLAGVVAMYGPRTTPNVQPSAAVPAQTPNDGQNTSPAAPTGFQPPHASDDSETNAVRQNLIRDAARRVRELEEQVEVAIAQGRSTVAASPFPFGTTGLARTACIPNIFGPCVNFASENIEVGERRLRAQAQPQIEEARRAQESVGMLLDALARANLRSVRP